MMEELLVGLDICDTYTQMCCAGQEKVHNFPTIICRTKAEEQWLIGQEAYASALEGKGVLVDKLLKLLRKDGTATICGVRYEGIDLMQRFLECVLARAMGEPEEITAAGAETSAVSEERTGRSEAEADGGSGTAGAGAEADSALMTAAASEEELSGGTGEPAAEAAGEGALPKAEEPARQEEAGQPEPEPGAGSSVQAEAWKAAGSGAGSQKLWRYPAYDSSRIGQLVITVPKVSSRLLDSLVACADRLGIPRKRVHIISHTESFLYYVLSQKREVWNNQVAMFDLSEDFLCYYEMKVQRGMRQVTVVAEREKLDEGFNLDILSTPSGMKLADKILLACGERFLQKKLFSSVFLTGKGFESQDWAKDFMKLVCTRRKVYVDQALFVQGAGYKAADLVRDKTSYPYILICDGHLDATVSMKVQRRDQEHQLVLAAAGDSWYEARSTMEFILDHQQYLEFYISPSDPKRRKVVKLILEGFPERDDKTLRIQVQVGFLDENTMTIEVKDMGFGEFYPSTGAVIRQEVML